MDVWVPAAAAAVVVCALVGLVAFIVVRLGGKPSTARLIAGTIIAVTVLAGAFPAIIAAFHG